MWEFKCFFYIKIHNFTSFIFNFSIVQSIN
nr:MAG TPA: hypothetical protein [Caudoviricetes sp.]